MKEAFGGLIIILGLVIVLIFGWGRLNDAEANRAYARAEAERARGEARAMVIEAAAESRLHSAQAAAITQASNLPYAVLGVGTVAALTIFIGSLMFLVWIRQNAPIYSPPRSIETRTIILLPDGMSHREFWRSMTKTTEIKLLKGGNNDEVQA